MGKLKNYIKGLSIYKPVISPIVTLPFKILYFYKWFLMAFQKNIMIDPCTKSRYFVWKMCGVKSNGKFRVGYDVYFDAENASQIFIEDGAWISSRCTLLCHKRNIKNYYVGDVYSNNPTDVMPIHIGKNVAIGIGSIIMPGVTIGEGSVIGSGSLVTKDIPAWCVAAGHPAKVIRTLEKRNETTQNSISQDMPEKE